MSDTAPGDALRWIDESPLFNCELIPARFGKNRPALFFVSIVEPLPGTRADPMPGLLRVNLLERG